jgi:hypothetical protein
MAKLIKTPTTSIFNYGDKVEFRVIDQHDNYSPSYKTFYGYAFKVGRVTMTIKGVDGEMYKANVNEVKSYKNPFLIDEVWH